MKTVKENLPLRERINLALARGWKAVVVFFLLAFLVLAGFFIVRYLNQKKLSDSAMLSEDIMDAYNEWIQASSDSRDTATLDELIDRATRDFPRQFAAQRAYFTRGLMALENESWEEATSAFTKLSDTWPNSYLAPVSLFNAASAWEDSGDIETARIIWRRLVDEYEGASPDIPEALFNLGRLADDDDEREKALEYYRDIVSRFPQSRWTNIAKSRILELENR